MYLPIIINQDLLKVFNPDLKNKNTKQNKELERKFRFNNLPSEVFSELPVNLMQHTQLIFMSETL